MGCAAVARRQRRRRRHVRAGGRSFGLPDPFPRFLGTDDRSYLTGKKSRRLRRVYAASSGSLELFLSYDFHG
jgi:hypothetical protein